MANRLRPQSSRHEGRPEHVLHAAYHSPCHKPLHRGPWAMCESPNGFLKETSRRRFGIHAKFPNLPTRARATSEQEKLRLILQIPCKAYHVSKTGTCLLSLGKIECWHRSALNPETLNRKSCGGIIPSSATRKRL